MFFSSKFDYILCSSSKLDFVFQTSDMQSEPTRQLVLEFTKMTGAGNDFVVLDNRFYHFSSSELSNLYAAFADLASTPTPGGPTERATLRTVANTLIATVNRTDSQLRDLQRSTDRSIVDLLPEINRYATRVLASHSGHDSACNLLF